MASTKRNSRISSYISEKRISQWEVLMRKFSKQQQCKAAPLEFPRTGRANQVFPTASQYEGSWDILGMNGYGTYTFPNGVIYEGEFNDGVFHGKGELQYEDGMVLRGVWEDGVMTERTLQFSENLEYSENGWKYCQPPDRRFAIEYDEGLMPAGKAFLTADQPTRDIPPGHYDTGDGFYDKTTKTIYKYDEVGAIVRCPSEKEQKWIKSNCRMNPEEPLGPRPDLYETFTPPVVNPPQPPPPVAGVTHTTRSIRTQSVFSDDQDFVFNPTVFKFYSTGDSSSDSYE